MENGARMEGAVNQAKWPDFSERLHHIYGQKIAPDSQNSGRVHPVGRRKKVWIAERRAAGRIPPPSVFFRAARMGAHSWEFSGKEPRKRTRSSVMIFGSWGPGSPGRVPASRNTSFLCLAISFESMFCPSALRRVKSSHARAFSGRSLQILGSVRERDRGLLPFDLLDELF